MLCDSLTIVLLIHKCNYGTEVLLKYLQLYLNMIVFFAIVLVISQTIEITFGYGCEIFFLKIPFISLLILDGIYIITLYWLCDSLAIVFLKICASFLLLILCDIYINMHCLLFDICALLSAYKRVCSKQ